MMSDVKSITGIQIHGKPNLLNIKTFSIVKKIQKIQSGPKKITSESKPFI